MGVTRYWYYSKERMAELIASGRIVRPRPGAVPRYRRYLDEMPGVPIQDVWTDITVVNSMAVERLGYPTQKPEALLERIINISSNAGDLVLDCVCGSGTTAVVAERLGRTADSDHTNRLARELERDGEVALGPVHKLRLEVVLDCREHRSLACQWPARLRREGRIPSHCYP